MSTAALRSSVVVPLEQAEKWTFSTDEMGQITDSDLTERNFSLASLVGFVGFHISDHFCIL